MVAEMPAEERNVRWRELCLVLVVSGLASELANLLEWSSPYRITATQSLGPVGVFGSVLTWILGPAIVLYVLICQGRTFRHLSLIGKRDLVVGTLVLIAGISTCVCSS
jgi:hypothetical protein